MRFVEAPIFTKRVIELLSDEDYSNLQIELLQRPEAGALIPGGGGLRKIGWRIGGKGKRGGVRIIYYWASSEDIIYMASIYRKSEQENLTHSQLRVLRSLIKEWSN